MSIITDDGRIKTEIVHPRAEPTEWERFWYDWIEPYNAQYWLALAVALILLAIAWRQRRGIFAVAGLAWSGARHGSMGAMRHWREIAVIGLLAFIAWRLA